MVVSKDRNGISGWIYARKQLVEINVGLTGSLAIHARIDHLWGSIESPFYEISAEKAKK
jgi:hypothetical protein